MGLVVRHMGLILVFLSHGWLRVVRGRLFRRRVSRRRVSSTMFPLLRGRRRHGVACRRSDGGSLRHGRIVTRRHGFMWYTCWHTEHHQAYKGKERFHVVLLAHGGRVV